ncbi:hypothetical protein QF000_006484 [Paraburkholderia atlantica]|uniref:hypothetical protein n=1 Tax=Paraburkholderia atlantica TaxID=2654982 RepID=UPI003D21EF9B
MSTLVSTTEDKFVVSSPDGLFYWPPVTIDEARQTIAKRSLCENEPGWEILPLWLALDHLDDCPVRANESQPAEVL